MRLIKLGLISIVVFYLLIWAITLLFPNVTVLSRVINIAGNNDSLANQIKTNRIPYSEWLTSNNEAVDVRSSDISFYENDLFNSERQENADTIYFELRHRQQAFLRGGLGLYQLSKDSVTTQLFYVFKTHWYKPWEKMAQMGNDTKYGGQIDSALARLKRSVEKSNH
jgi:hypothetical protein